MPLPPLTNMKCRLFQAFYMAVKSTEEAALASLGSAEVSKRESVVRASLVSSIGVDAFGNETTIQRKKSTPQRTAGTKRTLSDMQKYPPQYEKSQIMISVNCGHQGHLCADFKANRWCTINSNWLIHTIKIRNQHHSQT